jgi:hypothetical protein
MIEGKQSDNLLQRVQFKDARTMDILTSSFYQLRSASLLAILSATAAVGGGQVRMHLA